MQGILYGILVALANNIDNVSARIAFSLKGIKMSTSINLWISGITFLFSLGAAAGGGLLKSVIHPQLCSVIGMVIFTAMGLWFILDPLLKRHKERSNPNTIIDIMEHPEDADRNKNHDLDIKEATLLGVALSVDSIGGSLSAGMIGVNCLAMACFSASISFLALWGGNYLAKLFVRLKIGLAGNIAAGVLLIAVGIHQLF